jgi:hypothetical protein
MFNFHRPIIIVIYFQFFKQYQCHFFYGKDKFHLITGHDDPQREYRHIYTFSLTSALDGVSGQRHVPAALPLERPGTHCTGGWVGPRVSHDGGEISANTGIRFPDRPACSESLHHLSYKCMK